MSGNKEMLGALLTGLNDLFAFERRPIARPPPVQENQEVKAEASAEGVQEKQEVLAEVSAEDVQEKQEVLAEASAEDVQEKQEFKAEASAEDVQELCTAIESLRTDLIDVETRSMIDNTLAKLNPLRQEDKDDALEDFFLNYPDIKDLLSETQWSTLEITRNAMRKEHEQFATKALDYFLMYFGLRVPHSQESDEYYEPFVGEAILSLCMLYGKKWREELYKQWETTLRSPKYFVLRCSTVTTPKDGFYFFSYLFRVAFIFEMTLCLFARNVNFFKFTTTCTYRFVDVLFFRDEGNWTSLKNAASIIAIATRPLRFAINCPKNKLESFSKVTWLLEKYASTGKVGLKTKEIALLKQLDAKMKNRSPERVSNDIKQQMGQTLLAYLKGCFPRGDSISLEVNWKKLNLDEAIRRQAWLDPLQLDTKVFDKALRAFRIISAVYNDKDVEKEKKTSKNTKAHQLIREFDDVVSHMIMSKDYFIKVCQTVDFKLKESSVAIPKSKTKNLPRSEENYFQLHTNYVETIVEVYSKILPSFLNRYSSDYLAPVYKLPINKENAIFLIQKTYYDFRLETFPLPPEYKRMWGCLVLNDDYLEGNVKTGDPQVIPMNLQMLLDSYIERKNGEELAKFRVQTLCVPQKPKSATNSPVWLVIGDLDKWSNPLNVILKTILDVEDETSKGATMKLEKVNRQSEIEVQKFRFGTHIGEEIWVPEKVESVNA